MYAFETRIRGVIMELVEPCIKRTIQDREVITEVKKQNDLIKKKVDECEFIVQKAQKKTTLTDDLAK